MNIASARGLVLFWFLQILIFAAWTTPAAGEQVKLTVTERLGVDRTAEPVASGVPLPKGALTSAENVRLLRNGNEVPAQFRVSGQWLPGTSIRWLLVDFQADVKANEKQEYVLEYGPGVKRQAKAKSPVTIAETNDAYTVATGAATFVLSRRTFSLFEEVRLADGTVLVGRPTGGTPRFGARLRNVRAMVTRAIPGATTAGNSHLIYVRNLDEKAQNDYTLRFVSEKQYVLTGARATEVGRGEIFKDFTSSDGKISIPSEAWLRYHWAKAGDIYTFRTIPAGSSWVSEGIFETKVVESGPMRSVIRVQGSFGPATAPVMEFTAWYHFYAGSPRVQLQFTLENNGHGGRTDTGNANDCNIGGINCVFFDEMALELPVETAKGTYLPTAPSASVTAGSVTLRRTGLNVELYQDSNGGPNWNRYQKTEYHPRPNSYVSFKGFRIYEDGKEVGQGDRVVGWMGLGDRAGMFVAVRDFWQNFPKALRTEPPNNLVIGLFPGRYAGDFSFRSGEHKTHDILFMLHDGKQDPASLLAAASGFSEPLRAEPSADWFAKTRALSWLHPQDKGNYPYYETRNLVTVGEIPARSPDKMSLLGQIESHDFYGWMDYGDVPMDFEASSGQWNLKYDMDYHMAQQYARTLDPRWFNLFAAAARHRRDIDIHHQPHLRGMHFTKGGTWEHSQHGEPGHVNPHRNRGQHTKDLCYGARGTAALYYLTGDWKSYHSCLEIAHNALAEYMSPQSEPDPTRRNRMGWRGDAGSLNRLLEGWLLTGDEKLLERARWVIKDCAYVGKPAKHEAISLWSSTFYMMALSRYVEMFPEDAEAKRYLLAHLDTLYQCSKGASGMMYTITPKPDGTFEGSGTTSFYNVMGADALAIAYMLTGEMKYMDAARRCFDYGIRESSSNSDPPAYTQVHNTNGAMHGNVFMAVAESLNEQARR
jgi:hypothetical protein